MKIGTYLALEEWEMHTRLCSEISRKDTYFATQVLQRLEASRLPDMDMFRI
jgi:hypothetical protein